MAAMDGAVEVDVSGGAAVVIFCAKNVWVDEWIWMDGRGEEMHAMVVMKEEIIVDNLCCGRYGLHLSRSTFA